MPRTKISEFSATPASNTDIDSINISEGCAPSGINDAIRELMAQLKDFQTGAVGDSFNGPVGTTTAAAGAFTTLSSTGNTTLGDASGDSVTINGTATFANANPTLSAGTANGVAYLNGSKVVTSGSALTFNGTSFGVPNIDLNNGGVQYFYSTGFGSYFALTNNANALTFGYNGSEQMRLTSTGLGIGTSSVGEKLTVAGGCVQVTGNLSSLNRPSSAIMDFFSGQTRFFSIGADSATSGGFSFRTSTTTTNTERMVIDSSGNLGLGVTPSAWGGGVSGLQVKDGTMLAYSGTSGYIGANAYYGTSGGSGFKYYGTGVASLYAQESAVHKWFNAPSGTAGNAITLTQAMTLDASGNLLVGTTSSNLSSASRGVIEVNGASTAYIGLDTGGTLRGTFYSNGSIVGLATATLPLTFGTTGGTEWGRFNTSGTLLIGQSAGSMSVQGILLETYGTGRFVTNGGSDNVCMYLNRIASDGSIEIFQRNNTTVGSISVTTTATAYNTSSDQRLKENIQDADSASTLIDALQVRKFDWKADGSHQRYGFVAQELATVYPEAVHQPEDKEQMMAVDYSKLVPLLVKEIQSLKARLDAANL